MDNRRTGCTFRRGFTLIEVLVSISVIAILISITIPVLRASRDAGRTTLSQANLHSNAQMLYEYSSDRNEEFPVIVPDGASRGEVNMTRLEFPDGTWSSFSFFNHTSLWPAVLLWAGHESSGTWRAPSSRNEYSYFISDYLLSQAFMTDWSYWAPGSEQSARGWRAVRHSFVEHPSLKSMIHESPASALARSSGKGEQPEIMSLPVCFVDGHVDARRLLDSTLPTPNSMMGGVAVRLVMTTNGFRGRDY